MCGIVGIASNKDLSLLDLDIMISPLTRRGPDYKDKWISQNKNIFFGHTRLSILDISKNGIQPMNSNDKRFIISYNGEIYNHYDLRSKLKIKKNFNTWNSTSDTETLINYFQLMGINKTLEDVQGMFAFAIYDKLKEILYLARDPAGEKPLYYYKDTDYLIFSSDILSFKKFKYFNSDLDYEAINFYKRYGFIKSPNTIYKKVKKLPAGSFAKFVLKENKINIFRYFDLKNLSNEKSKNLKKNAQELIEQSVKKQMLSDVKLGSFLSGGIDSSLVTAIMQKYCSNKIDTFSIGFDNAIFDESGSATKVANFLNTHHQNYILKPQDVFDFFENVNYIYTEPFSDFSQIPTFSLSKFTKKHVKVALSGDGGDELFNGYKRYSSSKTIFKYTKFLPSKFRQSLNRLMKNFFLNKLIANFLNRIDLGNSNFRDKLNKLCYVLEYHDFNDLYSRIMSINKFESQIQENNSIGMFDNINSINENMNYIDFKIYLPDDILCKVDRASMFNSLETRCPLLDKNLINFVFNNSKYFHSNTNNDKSFLREIAYNYIPKELLDRPKKGFDLPLGDWLRKDLKELVEEILFSNTDYSNIFNYSFLKSCWKEHLNQTANNQYIIWNQIILKKWLQEIH